MMRFVEGDCGDGDLGEVGEQNGVKCVGHGILELTTKIADFKLDVKDFANEGGLVNAISVDLTCNLPHILLVIAYAFMRFTTYIVDSCSSTNRSDFTASIDPICTCVLRQYLSAGSILRHSTLLNDICSKTVCQALARL